ncbi:MAG TPA: PDZ domain-containing protein [Acidimicrobiales bacterium]|nr:PDZ domain-containing protein [Acidimicrobiales bacterium]
MDDETPRPAWLPPEDRLWRHPSEIALHGQPQGEVPSPPLRLRTAGRERRFAITAGVVGVAAVATVAAVAFSLPDSQGVAPNSHIAASNVEASLVTSPSTTAVRSVRAPQVMEMVDQLRPSLVAIGPAHSSTAARMTGVVLPGGNLAVTAAAAVGSASMVEIVTSSGRRRLVKVLGRDPHAGIAVVETGGGLSPASFAANVVEPGELAIAACLCLAAESATAAANATLAAVSEIRKVDTGGRALGGMKLIDTIEADIPLGPAPWGGVLMNGEGEVVGILDGQESVSHGGAGVFVPASLAVAVADELATSHTVEHGWLGIKCADVSGDGGARITTVMTGSPAAAAGLHDGDVVEAVDAQPIDSLADLQASLYTSPPGTAVSVLLARSGREVLTTMTLAGSPTG